MRPDYKTVVVELKLLDRLHEFHPAVIGTPPLGIDVQSSDIDIACSAADLSKFIDEANEQFGAMAGYACRTIVVRKVPAVCIGFRSHSWDIELFCQTIPVREQWGVRHFNVERRLLELEPRLRNSILELKRRELKTEPAFAQVLGLKGDPYEAVLRLEGADDKTLAAIASQAIRE